MKNFSAINGTPNNGFNLNHYSVTEASRFIDEKKVIIDKKVNLNILSDNLISSDLVYWV